MSKTGRTILFVQNSHFEAIGLECLSAVLKREGFSCRLFIYERNKADLFEYVRKIPDLMLFAFQVFTYQHDWSVDIIRELKREFRIPVVIGGGHPTFFPEECAGFPAINFLVRGEGEYPLLNLCKAIHDDGCTDRVKGVWARREDGSIVRNEMDCLVQDLDSLPFPDRSIYEDTLFFKTIPVKRFLTRRGCPHGCSFCFNKQLRQLVSGKGRYVRIRSPLNVIEEILLVKRQYGMKMVAFTDDDFTSDKKWCLDFLERYREKVALPFTAFGKASEIDEDLAQALKKAGCHMFAFGVESGNEDIRNGILKKRLSDEQIITATGLLHRFGVQFTTFSMMGNPGETFDDAVHTVKFNAALRPRVGVATVLNPYLETDIYKYCLESGLIDQSTRKQLQEKANVLGYTIFLKQPDMDKIVKLSKVYTMLLRFPSLIGVVVGLIRMRMFPLWFCRICYVVFAAFRQKVKLNLNWVEFIKSGIKVGKHAY